MRPRIRLLIPAVFALLIMAVIFAPVGDSSVTIRQELEAGAPAGGSVHDDLVCGMRVGEGIRLESGGGLFYFCAERCRELFVADPERYLVRACVVCKSEGKRTPVSERDGFAASWQEESVLLCSAPHRAAFLEDPAGFFLHSMWGIPSWLYYTCIALVMLLSFGIIERRPKRRGARALPMAGESPASSPRFDLMNIGILSWLFSHRGLRRSVRAFMALAFVGVIAAGLFGNQLPGKNVAPLLTWTIWWCGLVLIILFAGKAWCTICPWDALAGFAERVLSFGGRPLRLGLRWPKLMRNIWPATLLFIALTWFELGFEITLSPRATAYMGLAMFGLAFVSLLIFDRKAFCRYGCLVGRISGLYALFSPVEIRARDQDACASCETKSCYRGNDEGMACPTHQFLPTMEQNTYCISCLECVNSCEKDNVSINLRPWGADLERLHKPRSDEAYLALTMLSLSGFHGLTMTKIWQQTTSWIGEALAIGHSAAFTLGMVAITLAPIALYAGLVWLAKVLARSGSVSFRDYFIRYAYALLPIALFYHLAHNSEHLLMEGQNVVALASDPFGWNWDLFGTASWELPPLTSLPTLWLVQVILILVGHVYSLWVARQVVSSMSLDRWSSIRSQLPMLAAMILFSILSLWLIKQPMEMRSSAM